MLFEDLRINEDAFNKAFNDMIVGLVAGENTLTVKSNRTFDVDEYYTIVAVYNGSELIACGVSDPTDEAGEATCTFNIPEEDLNKCKFRTFAWTKDLKPL